MNKEQILLNTYVKQSAKGYIDFMGIERFPPFRILEKKMSLLDAKKKGIRFICIASL